MKQIFIDKFIIPQNAVEEFISRMEYNRNFIKNIQGFMKDSVYQSKDENGNLVIITVAEWKDETALKNAKELVQTEYKKIGFDPVKMTARLNIKMERGIYNEFVSPA
ncbi:MAG: hypothetical protein A2068_00220 [Ignavibacteria bacterium GWB2_35_6b]|nr:MAG: hypothetical protein A2068_00220 [Ignavibacteria bacterium GWB2_35_6b]